MGADHNKRGQQDLSQSHQGRGHSHRHKRQNRLGHLRRRRGFWLLLAVKYDVVGGRIALAAQRLPSSELNDHRKKDVLY